MSENNRTPVLEKEPPQSPVSMGRLKKGLFAFLAALGAGLVAALVSVVSMLILRLGAGIPTPVELFGDFVLKHLSVYRFVDMLLYFKSGAKTEPLGLTLLAMIALGTVLGLLYSLIVRLPVPVSGSRPTRYEWLIMLSFGLGMGVIGTVLFWTEIRQNFFGWPESWSSLFSSLGMFVDFLLYALVLGWSYRILLPKQRTATEIAPVNGRRNLLARTGVAVLGVGAAAGTVGLVRDYLGHYASYDGMKGYGKPGITSPITPNNEHYVVTQNPIDPTPSLNVWRLEVAGLVGSGGTYTYDEFIKLPSISRAVTLECIANGVGDHLISTAIWQGVTFRSLLEKHGGAQSKARFVVFSSVDGYTVSQPLDEVLATDALLAFRMNGVEIPERHGYPVRVLIPGHYGEENPKWLTKIELTEDFVGGLYSDQGWYYGQLHTLSRIDRPVGRVPFAPDVEIAGMSFAGPRGIQRVEVSTDNGQTWNDAQLTPPLSQDSWVLWTYQWLAPTRGHHTIVARATDGTGQVQTSVAQGTVPNGSTGYHKLPVDIV